MARGNESGKNKQKASDQASKHIKSLQLAITKAQSLAQKKKWKKAIALLEPLADELPESALLQLSSYCKAIKDFPSEIRHLNTLIKKRPQRMIYHFRRGHSYSQMRSQRKLEQKKMNQKAVTSLRKAIEIQPSFKSSYTSLLNIFQRSKNHFEARTLVMEMIHRFGDNPQYFTELCHLYLIDGYIDDGIRICKEATHRDPKEPKNHILLAKGYMSQGEESKAEAVLMQASKSKILGRSTEVQEANGKHYLDKKSFTVASKYFQKAIAIDPKHWASHLGLATSYFGRQKYTKALASYVKACQLSRSTIKPYRLAITRLRKLNKMKMANKYESQTYKCTTQL